MAQRVYVEGYGYAKFPDEATTAQIEEALNNEENRKAMGFTPPKADAPPPDTTPLGPIDTAGEVLSALGDAVVYNTPAGIATFFDESQPFEKHTLADDVIERARARNKEQAGTEEERARGTSIGFDVGTIRGMAPSIGFSLSTQGMGLAAYGATKAVGTFFGGPFGALATIPAARAAGLAATFAASYTQATNSFYRDMHDIVQDTRAEEGLPPMSDEEFSKKAENLKEQAGDTGFWEAITQTVSGGISFTLLTTPAKSAISALFGKTVLQRALTKGAALVGTEIIEEMPTQIKQNNAMIQARKIMGLPGGDEKQGSLLSPADEWEAFKQVAPSVILQTALMGGAFKGGHIAYKKLQGIREKIKNPDNLSPQVFAAVMAVNADVEAGKMTRHEGAIAVDDILRAQNPAFAEAAAAEAQNISEGDPEGRFDDDGGPAPYGYAAEPTQAAETPGEKRTKAKAAKAAAKVAAAEQIKAGLAAAKARDVTPPNTAVAADAETQDNLTIALDNAIDRGVLQAEDRTKSNFINHFRFDGTKDGMDYWFNPKTKESVSVETSEAPTTAAEQAPSWIKLKTPATKVTPTKEPAKGKKTSAAAKPATQDTASFPDWLKIKPAEATYAEENGKHVVTYPKGTKETFPTREAAVSASNIYHRQQREAAKAQEGVQGVPTKKEAGGEFVPTDRWQVVPKKQLKAVQKMGGVHLSQQNDGSWIAQKLSGDIQDALAPKKSRKVKVKVDKKVADAAVPTETNFPDKEHQDLHDAFELNKLVATGGLKGKALTHFLERLNILAKKFKTENIIELSKVYQKQVKDYLRGRHPNGKPIDLPVLNVRAALLPEEQLEAVLETEPSPETVKVILDQRIPDAYERVMGQFIEYVGRTLGSKNITYKVDTQEAVMAARLERNPNAPDHEISGFFSPNEKLIMVAFNPNLAYMLETVGHETFHAAQRILYRDNSTAIKLLEANYPQLRALAVEDRGEDVVKSYEARGTEVAHQEMQAIVAGRIIREAVNGKREIDLFRSDTFKALPWGVRQIYRKIIDFISRLGNFMRGQGFQSIEDVYRYYADNGLANLPASRFRDLQREETIVDAALDVADALSPNTTGRRARRALDRKVRNFKEWFKGSIITNDDGTPRAVYHGSTSFFKVFSFSEDIGFHFGTPEQANSRIRNKGIAIEAAPNAATVTGDDVAEAADAWTNSMDEPESKITMMFIDTFIGELNAEEQRAKEKPATHVILHGKNDAQKMRLLFAKAVRLTKESMDLNSLGATTENQLRQIFGTMGWKFNDQEAFFTEKTVRRDMVKYMRANPNATGLDVLDEFLPQLKPNDRQEYLLDLLNIIDPALATNILNRHGPHAESVFADRELKAYMNSISPLQKGIIRHEQLEYIESLQEKYKNKDIGGFIYQTYISMKNPVRMNDIQWSNPLSILAELSGDKTYTGWEERQDKPLAPSVSIIFNAHEYTKHRKYLESLNRHTKKTDRSTAYEYLRKILLEKGYDGIVYQNMSEGTHPEDSYIALKPNQIKSTQARAYSDSSDIMDSMVDTILRRASNDIPKPTDFLPDDMVGGKGTGFRWLSSVYNTAKKYPPLMAVFMQERRQTQDRSRILNESGIDLATGENRLKAMQFGDLGFGFNLFHFPTALMRGTLTKGKQSRLRVYGFLEVARRLDIKRVSRNGDGVYSIKVPDDMVGTTIPAGETITLTEEEAKALEGVRRGFKHLIREIKEGTLIDWGYDPSWTSADFKNAIQLLKEEAATELDPKERRKIDKKIVDEKVKRTKIQELEMLEDTDYVPFMRFGDYGYTIKKENAETGEMDMEWFETFETKGLHRVHIPKISPGWKHVANNRIQELRVQFPASEGYIHSKAPFPLTKDNILANSEHMMNFDLLASLLMGKNQELYKEIRDDLLDNLVKKRGFGAHLTRSKFVPGYHTGDPLRSIGSYAVAAANYAAKLRNQRAITKAVNRIRYDENGNHTGLEALYNYAREYLDYTSSSVEEWSFVRNFTFMSFLGFNTSSALIQAVTLPIFVGPSLSRFSPSAKVSAVMLKNFGKVMMNMGEFFKALKDPIGNPMLDKATWLNLPALNLPDHHKKALLQFIERGIIAPNVTPEQAGHNTQMSSSMPEGATRVWRGVLDVSSALFNTIETAARTSTFLTVLELADADPHFMDRVNEILQNDSAWKWHQDNGSANVEEFAGMMVDEAFGIFGKDNRAKMMRGPGAVIFQFSTYQQMMVEFSGRMLLTGPAPNRKAFAGMMIMLVLFGGWQGLPGAENLKELFESVYKMFTGKDWDIDTEIRELIFEATDSRALANIAGRGAVRELTGFSIEQRTTLGRIPAADIINAAVNAVAGNPVQLNDVMGTPGTWIIQRPRAAAETWKTSGPARAITEAIAPTAVNNIVTALRWQEEGARTRSGELLLKPEDIKKNKAWMAKVLGFNARDVTLAREKSRAINRAVRSVSDLQSDYYKKLAMAKVHFIYKRRANDTAGMAQYRTEIRDINKEIRDENKGKPQEDRIIIDMSYLSSLTRKLLRNPDLPVVKGIPRKARSRARRLSTIYMDTHKE